MAARTSGTAGRVVVYLARHGQTPLDESGVLRGRADPPLDQTGREQASRLGAVLGPCHPSLVVASPLQRAVQTARPVAGQAGLTVTTDQLLTDRDYGPWTGTPEESVIARWGSVDSAPGVEPALVVLVRAMTGLNAIAGRCREGAVAAVSHDAVNRQVLAALCPDLGDPGSIPQDNGCFNTLEWRAGKWAVLAVNQIPPASGDAAARLSGEFFDDLRRRREGHRVRGWSPGPCSATMSSSRARSCVSG
jgi:probable phosphoglycerate mutase